ncbi:MAG TPA: UDP-N-acetylglucosamine 2-epimerase (non-hydrolyzing), partial [Bacteroidales bacterium]|nr:UDP-N-acetylglucosamine 2-epimerase (non-hydrolyzing) [Bacteroidales bacterium]
ENVPQEKIIVTGNTVIDALYIVIDRLSNNEALKKDVHGKLALLFDKKINLEKSKIVLVTGHRRENFGEGFLNICGALSKIANANPDVDIIYPVHLNPNVQEPVYKLLGDIPNIHLIAPLDYLPFVYMMSKSYLILTDSGGIQEEAPGLGKPVLVMRDTTERPEAVDAGTVKLVGTDKKIIIESVQELLTNSAVYNEMSRAHNPYGDGKACRRIVNFLISK